MNSVVKAAKWQILTAYAGPPAPVIFEYCDVGGSPTLYDIQGNWRRGGTFQPVSSHTLTQLDLKLCNRYNPYISGGCLNSTVVVKVSGCSGQVPDESNILWSGSFNSSELPCYKEPNWGVVTKSFTIGTYPSLVAGTRYAWFLEFAAGSAGQYVAIRSGSGYPRGRFITTQAPTWNWISLSAYDMMFWEWGY